MTKKRRIKRRKVEADEADSGDDILQTKHEKWDINDEKFHKDEIDEHHETLMLNAEDEIDDEGELSDDRDDEEVLQLNISSEEEDDDEDDDDGNTENALSDKAWGKRKQTFYNTDYDGRDDSEDDNLLAEEEEREALSLQQRMIGTLQQNDFNIDDDDDDDVSPTDTHNQQQDAVQISNSLSKDDLIREKWPEFPDLHREFKVKSNLLDTVYRPLHEYSQKFPHHFSAKEIALLNRGKDLYGLYCLNVSFYLTLRAHDVEGAEDHHVISRILQIKQLIEDLGEPFTDDHIQKIKDGETMMQFRESKHKKSVKFKESVEENVQIATDEEDDGKRAITYSMARNKGLTPKRKREQRNPRVKHRKKFEKAIIKHKRVVRPVQKELKKYAGEKGGIRSNLTRSVRFK